ncbi:invertebrate-type lysozyme 6-like [Schistocerca cancellata]|uniref:invertebrate-type lysozyme 6-like n=1 Tax=Schistocerca cancellata TaxID=274614 RepID=UPI0021177FAF|nr:invertebrate-type lysozyme 6-like [Schistocerca cancellata]
MTKYFAATFDVGQLVMMSVLLPLFAAAATIPASSTNVTRPTFDSCFGCICEASSQCNPKLGCNNGVCGLFQITKPYWLDAGSPIVPGTSPDAEDAFERCTTHTFCALETVQLYMARYGKDCNNNGNVDCHDFALIHHLGPSCDGKPGQVYIDEFENCRFNFEVLNQP